MSAVSRPRVYTRIRPMNENEKRQGGEICLFGEKGHHDVLVFDKDGEQMKTRFDYVFDTTTTQDQIFKHVGPEVMNTLFSGYNASIFAYGQTGSGKTHTMEGDNTTTEGPGLIPRLIRAIFERFASNSEITDAKVEMSFVQIYQEKIQDLLNGRKQLDIHMDRTSQYIAKDATWRLVQGFDEALNLYVESVKNRTVTATEMNLVSSRSHTILMLKLQWDEPTLPGSHAQLNLVDLAGSEKLSQSGATGETMKEAIHINKSLSALGNVVSKLVDAVKHKDRRIHVPFKDSKLTYLLQSSLGGSNLVHFVLALSCSSLWKPESTATIDFGKRALQLVIRPVRNAIDYKRLEEMEAMIEKMRSHIRNLEEELRTNQTSGGGGGGGKGDQAAFLQLKQLHQEGEEAKRKRRAEKMKRTNTKSQLKTRTELNRIMANLPETLEDLTSHCVLFPSSKQEFRSLGGIEKLIHYIDKSPSTFYRAHAAHTVSHVIDDEGRELFGTSGGLEALTRLLQVKEERCKEAACVAFDAVCRGCVANKKRLSTTMYELTVELLYGYPNQQVQEAACTALAAIVDVYPEAKKIVAPLGAVKKLLDTIRDAPGEVVHVTKAATTCIGRLAHGDTDMQNSIAKLGGVEILIDDVLFAPVGERDHQVPILASYALVNLCCSNAANMTKARSHPQFEDVRYRLMEGLARAFGNNTVREGFGRATAQETTSPFPYYGVTVTDKWTALTCGGRPIFSTFMENPQFYLYLQHDTQLSLLIQDVLYEQRMQQKQKNNTVYMGIAVFHGDPELSKAGLKQLDFHGKMVDIAKFTSNCENVLHCTLKKSEHPYVLVPFTSQRGRLTDFALSVFGDRQLEFTAVPEMTGWVRTIIDGAWTEFTGRGGDGFDWRCNPQVRLHAKENARVVFVLSYLSLDQQRNAKREEGEEDRQNSRPRLHGRIFSSTTPSKRYIKALVPLPQGSSFIASNSFSSNSYITTSANLQAGQNYVYIPFTEIPYQDTWRLCVYCDTDEVEVEPLSNVQSEWACCSFSGTWASKALTISLKTAGKMCVVVHSKDTFLRISIADQSGQKLVGIDSFWNGEANVEYQVGDAQKMIVVVVEGMMRKDAVQQLAEGTKFDVCVFTDEACTVNELSFPGKPSSLMIPTKSTPQEMLEYPRESADIGTNLNHDSGEEEDDSDDDDEGEGGDDNERIRELEEELKRRTEENKELQTQLSRQQEELTMTQRGGARGIAVTPPSTPLTATGKPPSSSAGNRSSSSNGRAGSISVNASRRPSGTSPPPQQPSKAEVEMGKAIDDVLLRLGSAAQSEKPPTAAEWQKLRKELKDCQGRLVASRVSQ